MSNLLDYFKSQREAMIDLLTTLVNYESPSRDAALVNTLIDFLNEYLQKQGVSSTQRIEQNEVGDFLLAKWNESAPGKPILILGHVDTVHPQGSVAARPVRIDEDGRLYGPGAVDMKAGLTAALTAIQGLSELGEQPQRPVWMLFTSDEEIGSPKSTSVIEELAAQAKLVLVMEPGTGDGAIKIQRKGIATYRIHVTGRASHAGNAPEEGINALIELAQQMLRVNKLNDLKHGTSVSVTVAEGGTAGNVIPAQASAYIDTRVLTQMAMDQVRSEMLDVMPFVPGAQVTVEAIHARNPMEYNDLMKKTFSRCQQIGAQYGITVRGDSVGGGSDGNTTASMGIPTLDGLGPYGGGLHADHEHVLVNSLPERAALVAALIKEWPLED